MQQTKYVSYLPRADMKQFAKQKVAVYSRVSRTGEVKHHSIEMQTEHLEDYVNRHYNWEFVGHYVDEGITGTKLNRPAFNRMMDDVKNGKIDLILTKTVSRFGRNMAEVISIINELKRRDVFVIFENDNINTKDSDSVFYLQCLASQAEEEAKQNSENQKWAIRNRFREGIPNYSKTYGYKMVDHQLIVVPDEALVVKEIFRMYLSGMGNERIARALNKEGIQSPEGSKWRPSYIHRIIINEKYSGDLLMQKWYTADYLTKHTKRNRGEIQQYLVEDAHEAIIAKDVFNQAQAEVARRSKIHRRAHVNKNTNTVPRLFGHIIRCGGCGSYYQYKRVGIRGYIREIWACRVFLELGKSICPSKAIPENILINTTKEVLVTKKIIKENTSDDVITYDLLNKHISEIVAMDGQKLEYHFYDGDVITKEWEFISRKHSWTPEMKEKARQQALNRLAKKKQAEQVKQTEGGEDE